jgi:hypothetical protein
MYAAVRVLKINYFRSCLAKTRPNSFARVYQTLGGVYHGATHGNPLAAAVAFCAFLGPLSSGFLTAINLLYS